MTATLPPALRDLAATLAIMKKAEQAKPENFKKLYFSDPLRFVMDEYPWGKAGTILEHEKGPDQLQQDFLNDLGAEIKKRAFTGAVSVEPIMMAISSSVGTGKSTMFAWLGWFILRTRPFSIGSVTAGTFQQLDERTWADIQHWGRMGRAADEWDILASGIYNKKYPDRWKLTPKTAKAENAQSFAGQHARTSTSFWLFDESSEIPSPNWQAAYGCLTEGEPMMFAAGQMLRNSGEFYNVCFGGKRGWLSRIWDGRLSKFTNKQTIADWMDEYGEDSDFFRVRVLGLPPRASELQFIGQELVDAARAREHKPLWDEPLVVGFDAANGGQAKFVFAFRRGLDAKSIPPIVLPGSTGRDEVVAKFCEIMADTRPQRKVTAAFGDQAFGAVIMQRVRESGFTNVFEVNFGETCDNSQNKKNGVQCLNQRAFMWNQMKEWLSLGAIPDDEKLAQQFMGPGFHNRSGKLVLESKESMGKRGVKSPDYPDALCTTFFRKVAKFSPPATPPQPSFYRGGGSMSWAR